eukprot:11186607-Lingulodinium_polyedra.AAC.1
MPTMCSRELKVTVASKFDNAGDSALMYTRPGSVKPFVAKGAFAFAFSYVRRGQRLVPRVSSRSGSIAWP